MLKNFVRWFIVLGLSFLVANVLGWNQGKTFFYLYLLSYLFILLMNKFIRSLCNFCLMYGYKFSGFSFLRASYAIKVIIITLIATCLIAKILHSDFYLTYQISTFIACLFPQKERN